MRKLLINLILNQDGQGLVEYSLIISLVVLGLIIAVQTFESALSDFYQNEIISKWP